MKRALILGGASDIGFAIANVFAKNQYSIILAGRNEEALRRNARDIHIKYNVKTESRLFDANDFSTHKPFWKSIEKKPVVTACVFGYLGDQNKAEYDPEEALKIISTNYSSAVAILNLIAEEYLHQRSGTIIGISSVAGDRGRQSNYIYGSAKSALTTYLQGLRNHLYPENVHVMTVIAGFVNTKMTAHLHLPRLLTATPGQVADKIFKAYRKKKNVIYVKWIWRYIMLIIKIIPESMFKKMKM